MSLVVLLSVLKHFLCSINKGHFYIHILQNYRNVFLVFTYNRKQISPARCTNVKAFICFIINSSCSYVWLFVKKHLEMLLS